MIEPVLHYYKIGDAVTAFSTTRQGGYSQGQYGQFNINRFCGDDAAAIRQNRQALCQLLQITDDRLLMPHQVHLTNVAAINEAFLHLSVAERQEQLEGIDAMMTDIPQICIGVSTADCIPVLLYDIQHHAVCAVHAGWRGTVSRIIEVAIDQMVQRYGTHPSYLIAQIGPGISLDSFEVGDEVYDAFAVAGFDMTAISEHRQKSHNGQSLMKWHINLPECNRRQLIAKGVDTDNIQIANICTFQQCDTYFSARRLGINSGRIFTAIMIKS